MTPFSTRTVETTQRAEPERRQPTTPASPPAQPAAAEPKVANRPIIFSVPMVRALLDGRKTMTRRLAWFVGRVAIQVGDGPIELVMVPTLWQKVKPGDRLWVRESFYQAFKRTATSPGVVYLADADEFMGGFGRGAHRWSRRTVSWTPSIHMPRWASRLTLVVTATKIERLQAISKADAIAEGIERLKSGRGFYDPRFGHGAARLGYCKTAPDAFQLLWESLHGAAAWADNPEVVALTFTVHKQNIDTAP